MKRSITLIAMTILILIAFVISQKNTVEEAINDVSNVSYRILSVETYGNKHLVLSVREDGSLQFHVVKQGIIKSKVIYSGVQGDYERVLDTFGVVFIELPRKIMNNKHICFGIIDNNSIVKLEIGNNNTLNQPSITPTGLLRYWSADLTDFSNDKVILNGYDIEGRKILEREETLNW